MTACLRGYLLIWPNGVGERVKSEVIHRRWLIFRSPSFGCRPSAVRISAACFLAARPLATRSLAKYDS
jgi:hypothetical protein